MIFTNGPEFPHDRDEGWVVDVPVAAAVDAVAAQRAPLVLYLLALSGISFVLAVPLWPHANVLLVSGSLVLALAFYQTLVSYRAERRCKDSRVYIRGDGVLLEQGAVRWYWPYDTIAGLVPQGSRIVLEHVGGAIFVIPCHGPHADDVRAVLTENVPRAAPMLARRRFLFLLASLYVLVALGAAVWSPTALPL